MIQYTDEPDMITLECDPRSSRYKMPHCGHAITQASLKEYYQKELSFMKYPVQCPGYYGSTRCEQLWDVKLFKRYANLSLMESINIDRRINRINQLKSPDNQECPLCKTICTKNNKSVLKVLCTNCTAQQGTNKHFCWVCLQPWLHATSSTSCGNYNCPGVVDNNERLKNAHRKTIGDIPNCPAIRACSHCKFIIEHDSDCKHMMCGNCQKKFCFVCLSVPDVQGYYPCGGVFSVCRIAPIQTV